MHNTDRYIASCSRILQAPYLALFACAGLLCVAVTASRVALADNPPATAAPAPINTLTPTAATTPGAILPVTSLIPSNAELVLGIDSHWLWDSSAPLRAQKDVSAQLSEMQAMLNVDIAGDITPWLGSTYVVLLPGATPTATRVVLIGQIRDSDGFATALARMKTNLALRPHITLTTVSISGHNIVHVNFPDKTAPQLTLGSEGGWVLFSNDGLAIRSVIETEIGATPNVASSTGLTTALNNIDTANAAVWGVLSSDALTASMSAAAKSAAPPFKSPFKGGISAFKVTDGGMSLRLDANGYMTDPKATEMMSELQKSVKPVTGESLSQVPDDAVGCMIGSTIPEWLSFARAMIAKMGPSVGMPQGFDPMSALTPFNPILQQFTGEFNIAALWQNNEFGVVAAFGTDSPANAHDALAAFVSATGKMQVPLQKADGMYSIAGMPDTPSPFPISPSFRDKDSYFQATTAKQWFQLPEGTPKLVFPAEAVGSIDAAFGNLTFMNDVLDGLEKSQAKDPGALQFVSAMRSAHVADGSWATWGKIAPGGATSTSTLELNNFDWKAVITQGLIAKQNAAAAAAAPAN